MALPFPTGQTHTMAPKTGYPQHPEPRHMCHCGDQHLPDEIGSCQRCGRFPAETISRTWEQRKREIAAKSATRRTA